MENGGMAKRLPSDESAAVVETVGSETVSGEPVASVAVPEPEQAGVPTLPLAGVRRLTLDQARALHPQHR